MMAKLLYWAASLCLCNQLHASLSTNQLIYLLDFDAAGTPEKLVTGTGNVPFTRETPVRITPGGFVHHETGGVNNSGYIRATGGTGNSLQISNGNGLPLSSRDFSISFNVRHYAGGSALFALDGATVNSGWTIWGAGGTSASSWKDESGNSSAFPPAVPSGDEWHSVVYSIHNKTINLFIDGRHRGTCTIAGNFQFAPRIHLIGLGCTGNNANEAAAADFDNIALWGKAITTEEEARAVMEAVRPDLLHPADPSAPPVDVYHRTWNFNEMEDWQHMNQNTPHDPDPNPEPKTVTENGLLAIHVRKGTQDRRKVLTKDKIYTTGRYKWRLYLPRLDKCGRTSVGAWIYCDDQHELDFEIGSGTQAERTRLGAGDDDLVVAMTSQANPYVSGRQLVKTGWHTVEMDLTLANGNYEVKWLIDGEVRQTQRVTFGTSFPFFIYCSVENLGFMGDHLPTQDNTAYYDRVEYYNHP